MNEPAQNETNAGVAYGVAAYLWWGLVPIYFRAIRHVPAMEILVHRVVWSIVLLAILMRVYRRWPVALAALRDRQVRLTLLGTTTLIAINWLAFIWAVANDQVLQASLGYYINPLVNVLLGFVFLRERLRPTQGVCVLLAATGVVYLTVSYGTLPWLALLLAGSFGCYGLLRKTARVDSLVGLMLETLLLAPLMLGYFLYIVIKGQSVFVNGPLHLTLLLPLGGVITAVPLLWFANAARRLRLATLGLLQYIAPSGQFLLAVVAFGESFTRAHLVSFVCIWTALTLYSVDAIRAARRSAG